MFEDQLFGSVYNVTTDSGTMTMSGEGYITVGNSLLNSTQAADRLLMHLFRLLLQSQ
jgi:hypothetical protein